MFRAIERKRTLTIIEEGLTDRTSGLANFEGKNYIGSARGLNEYKSSRYLAEAREGEEEGEMTIHHALYQRQKGKQETSQAMPISFSSFSKAGQGKGDIKGELTQQGGEK